MPSAVFWERKELLSLKCTSPQLPKGLAIGSAPIGKPALQASWDNLHLQAVRPICSPRCFRNLMVAWLPALASPTLSSSSPDGLQQVCRPEGSLRVFLPGGQGLWLQEPVYTSLLSTIM